MLAEDGQSILIDFLRRLIKGAPKKVFLLLDNLRVHHSKPVKACLAKHTDDIEVFYLPSYSPALITATLQRTLAYGRRGSRLCRRN